MYEVLVVDDSASMRIIIKDIINSIDGFNVIDTAVDAYDARDKIKLYEPDLVTIDLNMPKMSGSIFLKNLMKLHPMPAVIISSKKIRSNNINDEGAIGFIEKPKLGETMNDFEDRIKCNLLKCTFLLEEYVLKKPRINKSVLENKIENKIHPDDVLKSNPAILPGCKIIGIGSSTGGVESLLKIFKVLPSNLPPIIITQHIPYRFSGSFANRLNNYSDIIVQEATSGMVLEKGNAYLAPGNQHLTIEKEGKLYITKLLDTVKVSRHKPSINIMFRSLNNIVGSNTMAIIMTGMGDDGCIAIKELYDNGAYTLAQNEESCIVFGMPKVAIKSGAIKEICHLNKISQYIIEFSQNKRK